MEAIATRSGLFIEQMYTGCLAEAAYYLESNGEVAIIDPMRETQPYIDKAAERGAKIKYVFETHFHADFVSGHVDLSRKTGARIIYGPKAETSFDIHVATDNEEFKLGDVSIKVLHTPGHTPESSCYLLHDDIGKEYAVFTGDTLFIGEVGRPDLAIKSDLTREDLAGMLYESLHQKLMVLPDDVIVFPAHGAGSACGKNISQERSSTIGLQKKLNYALQAKSKKDFIEQVTTGILPAPQYFAKNAAINKNGYGMLEAVMRKSNKALSPNEVQEAQQSGAMIIDTRPALMFGEGFIPGSLFFGLDGSFASWVGTLVTNLDQPIVLITDPGREEEAIIRLARVGYTNALGYLEGGFKAWVNEGKPLDNIKSIDANEFAKVIREGSPVILDVRKPTEFSTDHIQEAITYPLDYINDHLEVHPKGTTYYLHCRSGYRSMVAASIMRNVGYEKLVNIDGGMVDITETDIPRVEQSCSAKN